VASSRTAVKAPADIPLDQLHQHPGNPRKITKVRLEQLQRTLTAERDMLAARPLIALPDGTVIAGNQRLAAARELGWETIPVVYADLDEETAARWMLLDNRPAGEDDTELLAAMLREMGAAGTDVDLAGYLPADVDAILRAAQPVSTKDPDDAPALPAEARSVRGEVYELGPHRGEMLDRRCFAMELDPGYCDVIRQRYADYTNQPHLAP
jgi:ParB-like chromosome segregation protein Spo0J